MASKTPERLSVALIGCGKMGSAILGGWIASDRGAAAALFPQSFTVVNPGGDRCRQIESEFGVRAFEDLASIEAPDVVVLAVKPQKMSEVLAQLQDSGIVKEGAANPLFVSIAAGISTERIASELPSGARVVRVMPNTPLLVGAGASGVCAGADASEEDVDLVVDLFSALGEAYLVPESDMDAVCAVSGSGPAYVARFLELWAQAGVEAGLDAELSAKLAAKTLSGTAELLSRTGQTPEECRIAVSSPGGTTLAALDAMEKAGFPAVMEQGVLAAEKRSKELASC